MYSPLPEWLDVGLLKPASSKMDSGQREKQPITHLRQNAPCGSTGMSRLRHPPSAIAYGGGRSSHMATSRLRQST